MIPSVKLIQASGLSKIINSGERTLSILQNLELNVNPGETVAILGASGSGKSTLLGLLAGLDYPTSGKVFLDGVDLFSLNEDERARLRGKVLGFVFQSFQLIGSFTALENVMLPLELAQTAQAEEKSANLLKRVGLQDRLHHYPNQLSGGEQQRVAISRAFSASPKLLLADEPTGNLDSDTGATIIDLLFELNREQGATLVLVTHDVALASRCQRRLRLIQGRLEENL